MNCCNQCQGLENLFDSRFARRDLKAYRQSGPTKQTRVLLRALRELGVKGRTLLDIGGGVGAIQHELMKNGLDTSTDVDASSAYLAAAREEANRQGYADRANYLHGNFIDLAPQIDAADIVTLDRVICCFPDMYSMVRLSAERAKQFYALVYPRDSRWTRLGGKAGNTMLALQRSKFRFFVHPAQEVDSIIREAGLQPRFHGYAGLVWQVAVYAR